MKKITLTLFALTFICQFAFSQSLTKGFSFQGYALDADDRAIASTNINVEFYIHSESTSQIYTEEHTTTTDPYGVFSAIVGEGTRISTDLFKDLKFNYYDFKLRVRIKKASGGTYATISDKTLNAVPYAQSAANGAPVGTIIAFAGPADKLPEGWLLCDGSDYDGSSSLYAPLFDVIGNTWGTNGTNFKVPDLRGQFLRGLNTTGSGTDANRTLGSSQGGAIQSHNHTASQGSHSHTFYDAFWNENKSAPAGSPIIYENNPTDTDNVGGGNGATGADHDNYLWSFQKTTSATAPAISIGSSGGTETRPVNKAVNYIIKY